MAFNVSVNVTGRVTVGGPRISFDSLGLSGMGRFRMRASNGIILVVAVILAGIAAFLARNWLVSHAQSSSTTTIVVAASPFAYGAQLTAENLSEIPWDAGALPDGAFASTRDLLKDGRRMALAPIARKEPILRSKITAPGQRATLSTVLDLGKRAVTVRVDDVRGVAGFIQPGDRVDVVLIRSQGESENRRRLLGCHPAVRPGSRHRSNHRRTHRTGNRC